jgi:hypothetical protein
MKKNNKIIIGTLALAVVALLGVKFLSSRGVEQQNVTPVSEIKQIPALSAPTTKTAEKNTAQKESHPAESTNTQSVTLTAGSTSVRLRVAPNTIFYDALVQAQAAGQIAFSGKNYPGLGFFVTDIGTLHSGGGKDLLYYVNGKEAAVGVSSYTLKDSDVIEWKLE